MGRPWELVGLRVEFVREHPLPLSLPLLSSSPHPAPTSRRPASTGGRLRLRRTPPPPSAHAAHVALRPAGACGRVAEASRGSGLCQLKFLGKSSDAEDAAVDDDAAQPQTLQGERETDSRGAAVAVGPPELGCVVRRQTAKRWTKDRLKRGRESSGTKVKREREREWDDHKEAEEASGRGRVLLSLGRCVSQRVDCRPSKLSEHAREGGRRGQE